MGVPFREAERAATASTRKYKGRQRAGRWAGVRVGTRWVCRAPKTTVKKRLKNGILRGIFCGPSAPQVQKFQWPKTRLAQAYVKVEGGRDLFAVNFGPPGPSSVRKVLAKRGPFCIRGTKSVATPCASPNAHPLRNRQYGGGKTLD